MYHLLNYQSKTIFLQCNVMYFTISLHRPSLLDKLQQSNEEVKAYLTQKQGELFFYLEYTESSICKNCYNPILC